MVTTHRRQALERNHQLTRTIASILPEFASIEREVRVQDSILERLWRLAAGAAASYPRRRQRRRRRRRGIILRCLLLLLVLRIVIGETLSTKRKSGTEIENE